MPTRVEVSLTGEVAIRVDGAPRVGRDSSCPVGPLAQVALACLVLQRDRLTPREELAEVLWDDCPPNTWRSALRGLLSRLRAALASAELGSATAITNFAGSYQLRLPPSAVVDVEAASDALARARSAVGEGAAHVARDHALHAVSGTTGEFLPGARTRWVQRERAQLHEAHVQSLELLSQAALVCGDHLQALRAAERAASLEPVRESAHLRVLSAHLAAGNRGEAIQAYHRCRQALAGELGVSPSAETEATYRRLLSEDSRELPEATPPTRTNLPASVDRFIDPGEPRVRLRELLASTRLLTLTGPAGIGKSRLALETSRERLGEHPDGVWIVDLGDLTEAGRLAHELCFELGLQRAPQEDPLACLTRQLADRQLLLVLDNCERVIWAAATVTDALLRASAGLTVLATTREPLRIPGETIWPVPPLATPPDHAETLGELWDVPSVRLFAARAAAVAPDVALEYHAAAIARICHRLDGVPLAIELAAAHTRALDLAEIADRLHDHLGFLAGPPSAVPSRHHSLQATLDWSYDSLAPSEKDLFAQLAVFPGGFGLDAAKEVCAAGIGDLEALVAKSLVSTHRSPAGTRYRMLEPVRQFAAEKLAAPAERAARDRFVAWAQRLAHTADGEIKGPAQQQWLARLDAEIDNLLGALAWAAAQPRHRPTALRLAIALWRYWELRGHLGEGRGWLEPLAAPAEVDPSLRAHALNAAGVLAHHQSDFTAARRLYRESLALRRELGDRTGIATSLNGLGHLSLTQGDFAEAQRVFRENLTLASALAHPNLRAACLMNLGVAEQHLAAEAPHAAARHASTARARRFHYDALAAYRALGDDHGVALSLENLGALAASQGHDDEAAGHLHESLALRRALNDRIGICGCTSFLGELALRHGDHDAARHHLEESLTIARELGSPQRETQALDRLTRLPCPRHGDRASTGRPPRRKAELVPSPHAPQTAANGHTRPRG